MHSRLSDARYFGEIGTHYSRRNLFSVLILHAISSAQFNVMFFDIIAEPIEATLTEKASYSMILIAVIYEMTLR